MIAVLDQSEHHVVAGKPRHQGLGVLPRHVGIFDALQDTHRTAGLDHAVEQEMTAAVFNQPLGHEVRLVRILRRPLP
jgi:hypothetical protein